jgi:hypothetical protein
LTGLVDAHDIGVNPALGLAHYRRLPDEESVLGALREKGVAPGYYFFPHAPSMKACGSPEMLEKYNRGPVGSITIMPSGPPAMGKSLVQWFGYSLAIGVLVAYAARIALGPGAGFVPVFRVTGTAAMLGYALSSIPDSIWKGQSWGITAKFVVDGIVYGLVTGATFGWLWPEAG